MRGHVRKRGIGYQFTVDLGNDPLTNKRKQKSQGGFRTEKEAERGMNELINQLNKGDYTVNIAINENMLFKDFVKKWLITKKNNLREKTYDTYTDLAEWYILPKLGDAKLKDLKPYDIQEHYAYLQNELKLSGTTACHVHNVINSSLNEAVKWDLLFRNPCDKVTRPKRNETEVEVLDIEEVARFFNSLIGSSLYLPTVIAVTTGMRRSEILGLKWDDIDFKTGTIYVKKQLKKVCGSFKLLSVKTDASKRNILLLDFTIEALKNERQKQLENKEIMAEQYINNNYVCCMGDGRPYDPEYISRHFLRKMNKLSTELEIPKITFHELRHTHATLLLKSNINPKVVSERLGHGRVNITLDTYSHVLPSMQKDAVEKLNAIMKF